MYYIIETRYVGPNRTQDRYVDADTIEIRTSPAITNSSHEERIEGWCGTTNDWAIFAHGEYESFDSARAAITEKFGYVRECDPSGDDFESDNDAVVETYKPGRYAPMSREATEAWAYPGMEADIAADTTDERIADLVAEYEAEANINGCTLADNLEESMQDYRQELRDEIEADEA